MYTVQMQQQQKQSKTGDCSLPRGLIIDENLHEHCTTNCFGYNSLLNQQMQINQLNFIDHFFHTHINRMPMDYPLYPCKHIKAEDETY